MSEQAAQDPAALAKILTPAIIGYVGISDAALTRVTCPFCSWKTVDLISNGLRGVLIHILQHDSAGDWKLPEKMEITLAKETLRLSAGVLAGAATGEVEMFEMLMRHEYPEKLKALAKKLLPDEKIEV